MPPPYCGGKTSPPRGRAVASNEDQCTKQVRAYGRRLVSGRDERAVQLLRTASRDDRNCGARTGASRMDDCGSQVRLYGLLPALEDARDMRRRTFVAQDAESYVALPRVDVEHPYTRRALDGTNTISRGGELLFVSVGAEGVDASAWQREPTRSPGGVGFAFGYFPKAGPRKKHTSFYIVHVYVNPPYRKGSKKGNAVSSWVVKQLVHSVKARHRARGGRDPLVIEVDPNAPCFQLGRSIPRGSDMTEQQSRALQRMYEGAGFDVIPLPHEGPRRRMVRLVVEA